MSDENQAADWQTQRAGWKAVDTLSNMLMLEDLLLQAWRRQVGHREQQVRVNGIRRLREVMIEELSGKK